MRICKQDNYLLGSSRVIPYGLVVVLGGLFVTVCDRPLFLWNFHARILEQVAISSFKGSS